MSWTTYSEALVSLIMKSSRAPSIFPRWGEYTLETTFPVLLTIFLCTLSLLRLNGYSYRSGLVAKGRLCTCKFLHNALVPACVALVVPGWRSSGWTLWVISFSYFCGKCYFSDISVYFSAVNNILILCFLLFFHQFMSIVLACYCSLFQPVLWSDHRLRFSLLIIGKIKVPSPSIHPRVNQ